MPMPENLREFTAQWAIDTEYTVRVGGRPDAICLVAHELLSGRIIRLSGSDLHRPVPAFLLDMKAIFISYFAPAEWSVFLALGWPLPEHVIDMYAEFRNRTNGISLASKGQLAALQYFGLQAPMETEHKNKMRVRCIQGGPFLPEELAAIVEYCHQDVVGLARLFRHMASDLDLPCCLIRGRYTKALAFIEANGIPMDVLATATVRECLPKIHRQLIYRLDSETGFWDSWTTRFKYDRFAGWLSRRELSWPLTETGRLALDRDTVKMMAGIFPELSRFRELKTVLSNLGLMEGLAIGPDGRNRTMLSPFSSVTGRNQPSGREFILSLPKWARSLIKPQPGYSIAELDFEQEEFGIAAALSGDRNMMVAAQGEPYITFAKQAGLVPSDATKESHPLIRARCKTVVLGVQYTMGARMLSFRLQQPLADAEQLLGLHHETYGDYWDWNNGVLNYALLNGSLETTFGWTIHATPETKPSTLRNFLVQANAGEILRLACIFAVDSGVKVCAPNHDSLLIEAPTPEIEDAVKLTKQAMADASRIVLDGFEIRSSVNVFHAPDRYRDEDGGLMWRTVWDIIATLSPALAEIAEQCR
jgi:DNA polymerase I